MYRQMVLIRHFEELALKLNTEGRIHGVVHPYAGQEAIAVGVCANLRVSDRIVSTHRGHGHCIAKGIARARAARCTSPTLTSGCWAPTASSEPDCRLRPAPPWLPSSKVATR